MPTSPRTAPPPTCLRRRPSRSRIGVCPHPGGVKVGSDDPRSTRPDPERPRERMRVVGLTLAAVAVVLVLGFLGARPTPILGLDGGALQASVGTTEIPMEGNSCEREGGGNWTCLRHDEEFSGTVPYRVHVNGLGCWHAKLLVRPDRETGPEDLSGCIGLVDYVFGGGGGGAGINRGSRRRSAARPDRPRGAEAAWVRRCARRAGPGCGRLRPGRARAGCWCPR